MSSKQRGNKQIEEEQLVGDQLLETRATLGASSLGGEEEGRVAGFFLQGKKVISTGFTPRQVFLFVPETLSSVMFTRHRDFELMHFWFVSSLASSNLF